MDSSNKKLIITIVILILIIAALVGFIYYDKILKTKDEGPTITTVDDVKIDLNVLYQVGDILNQFDNAFGNSISSYSGYIYKNKLYAKDFKKDAALYASMYNSLKTTDKTQYLQGADVKRNFEKVFGSNLKYTPQNVFVNENLDLKYDATNDRYSYTNTNIINQYAPRYVEINTSTSLTDDSIIVRRKVFYLEYNTNGTTALSANIYASNDKLIKIGMVNLKNGVVNLDEVMAKYSSRLRTYKYVFKSEDQSTYSFYSIERER